MKGRRTLLFLFFITFLLFTWHIVCIAIAALRQLKDVQYIKASVMMRELERARKNVTYTKYLEEKAGS